MLSPESPSSHAASGRSEQRVHEMVRDNFVVILTFADAARRGDSAMPKPSTRSQGKETLVRLLPSWPFIRGAIEQLPLLGK